VGTPVLSRLEEHPNLPEIVGVLARLPHLGDAELCTLAAHWRNSHLLAEARDCALSPDSPLVLEVLAAFDAVSALFAEDLEGSAPYLQVDREVVVLALKAVRDALAAGYARPVLSPAGYAGLMAPWAAAFPGPPLREPDLGPQAAAIHLLLAALPGLGGRCHDPAGRRRYDALVALAWGVDPDRHDRAREQAFTAAVLLSRRRVWVLLRRTVAEALCRPCLQCRTPRSTRDQARVLALCADAACALLVADGLASEAETLLTAAQSALLPDQREPGR